MLEFIEDEHIYLLDGVIIPSVSEILHFIFPDKYKGVPNKILSAKADYGTTIHKAIEKCESENIGVNLNFIEVINLQELLDMKLNYIQEESFIQYLVLKYRYNIEVLEQEQMIHYENKYAGRFDMIARINGDYCLCDIKTTSILDKEYLSWQLSLYAFAKKEKFDKLYAIWLPKEDLGKLVEIERKSDEEILEMLRKYEERNE